VEARNAVALADEFERVCVEQHAREQAEEQDRKARELEAAEEQVRRVGRYRVPARRDPNRMGEWIYITATVDTVKDGLVTFHAHPEWHAGKPKTVAVGTIFDPDEGFEPAPLTYADFPTVATDALPTVAGMADADALLRAEMAERGKTAG
jgi:hypothetical protein